MARAGADIIDFAVEAMANLTSQPSLNACCVAMEGNPRYPKVDYMSLEPCDMFPFEFKLTRPTHLVDC